jgi:ABC-type bacteriocin/lantibiotic exporter with double-glycine peptidase domain
MSFRSALNRVCGKLDDLSNIGTERMVLPDFPYSAQLDGYACGAHAMSMVLEYYFGERVDLEEIKRLCNTTKDGTETRGVMACLRHFGLRATQHTQHKGMNDRIRQCIDAGNPVLAVIPTRRPHVEHWVVVYGYETAGKRLIVRDSRVWVRPDHVLKIREFVTIGEPKSCDNKI